MRDDLHKAASIPLIAQRWAKMSLREADVLNGRVGVALENLVHSECDREISPRFLKWLAELYSLGTAPLLLADQADFLDSPSGNGGPLEHEVLCAVSDLMNKGAVTVEQLHREAVDSLGRGILDRLESYIRALEARAQADRSPETRQWIKQMRKDSRRFDSRSFANNYLRDSRFRESRPEMPPPSPDDNLATRATRKEDNDE